MAIAQPTAGDGWHFAIDVGGTFTDCVARDPAGVLHSHKLLSSGEYRGRVGAGSAGRVLCDVARQDASDDFFRGWRIKLLRCDRGASQCTTSPVVLRSDSAGTLEIDSDFVLRADVGAPYALYCDLEAPIVAIRHILGLPLETPIGAARVRVGTTRGTNALLERRGARTALVTTVGFADLLRIGNQARPRLFDLHIRKPLPLYERVIEVNERIDAHGGVIRALDRVAARDAMRAARDAGVEAVAICLLNSHRNAAHERAVADIAADCGFSAVSTSENWPVQRIVPRAETTVVDAYLTPTVRDYVQRLQSQLGPHAQLQMMTSAGDLSSAGAFAARDSVLSGPAGGVVAVDGVARSAGITRAIGFDMGGTSTDVSRVAGGPFERRYESTLPDGVGGPGTRIVAPLLALETVAAGGGSICDFDGVKPTVGPQSAGANPGPACYGAGGPLCITDVNLLLGRIPAQRFPFPLHLSAARDRLSALIERIADATGRRYTPQELALGYIRIADAHMAAAIRDVSVRQGHDPRDHALICFGGAGGQHCCAVAAELGIGTIIVPPLASVLSAYGISRAAAARLAVRDVALPLDANGLSIAESRALELESQVRRQLLADGVRASEIAPPRIRLDIRYIGQDSTFTIDAPDADASGPARVESWRTAFEAAHERLYGFAFRQRSAEIRAVHVELRQCATDDALLAPSASDERGFASSDAAAAPVMQDSSNIPIVERAALASGAELRGPALVAQSDSAIWIDARWRARVDARANLILEHDVAVVPTELAPRTADGPPQSVRTSDNGCDPVTLELFANTFASIATQMGAVLQRTSLSTNVKERLDFSCAVFDARGDLVAHAPHIPVHLGAMGECVRAMIAELRESGAPPPRAGDVFVTNDPYRGGSHLPDVTVMTPVFVDAQPAAPAYFVASRAHHAEIGGISPGSMPPHSRTLGDEGVFIPMMKLVDAPAVASAGESAHFREAELRALLTSGPHPSRAPDQNIADLRAQVAANQAGVGLLQTLTKERGAPAVAAYMRHLQDAAAAQTLSALHGVGAGVFQFAVALDDGTPIVVRIEIQADGAVFDFAGSGGVHAGNLNATPAIVASAVLYCLRCLIGRDAPLNAGILRPVKLNIPRGALNPPADGLSAHRPAVVGGNVETSQRIVDVIFGALGVLAASQGTMNNLAFGDAKSGYYETIGGGAGAGPDFDGADAVHVHMTNTRLTDPEVLEERYPVRVRRFAIRRGSGGRGRQHGGDGIVRETEFLAPLEVSLLTQRRMHAPFGLAGGAPGAMGINTLIHADGSVETLAAAQQFRAAAGDVLRMETPGGGGFGRTE